MIITDLPYDMGFDDFEKLLNKHIESGFIKDWFNYSEGSSLKYEVIFEKGKLKKETGKTDVHIPNKFKLIKRVPENQLYVLDENNKVRYFETPSELIKYFADFRLSVYDSRKTRLLKVLSERLTSNSDMCKFIDLIIRGVLKINNRPKADIKVDMKSHKLPESLISTPISKLTKEEYEALLKENEEIKREIEYIKNTTIEQMYLKTLKELRKEIAPDFPTEPNETDKVQREKKVNIKTEEMEVVVKPKRKRRTKAEMEAAKQAVLEAEVEGIRAKGDAEAEAMDKKAEAYKKSEFAKLEMVLEMHKTVLPQVAENVAKPMSSIDNVTIYGQSGAEMAGVSENIPVNIRRTFDIVKNATGVDLGDVMKAETIDAKVNKNVTLNGGVDID